MVGELSLGSAAILAAVAAVAAGTESEAALDHKLEASHMAGPKAEAAKMTLVLVSACLGTGIHSSTGPILDVALAALAVVADIVEGSIAVAGTADPDCTAAAVAAEEDNSTVLPQGMCLDAGQRARIVLAVVGVVAVHTAAADGKEDGHLQKPRRSSEHIGAAVDGE